MFKEMFYDGRSIGLLSSQERQLIFAQLIEREHPTLIDGENRSIFCLGHQLNYGERLLVCTEISDVDHLRTLRKVGVYTDLTWYVGHQDQVADGLYAEAHKSVVHNN